MEFTYEEKAILRMALMNLYSVYDILLDNSHEIISYGNVQVTRNEIFSLADKLGLKI